MPRKSVFPSHRIIGTNEAVAAATPLTVRPLGILAWVTLCSLGAGYSLAEQPTLRMMLIFLAGSGSGFVSPVAQHRAYGDDLGTGQLKDQRGAGCGRRIGGIEFCIRRMRSACRGVPVLEKMRCR